MRLSAALIARDEGAFIEGCLASLKPHVDEIVLVDTGSRDGTVEMAARAGAHVIERPWPDDFSIARNWALDAARGDWILYIDADERLAVPAGVDLRALLGDAGVVAYMVRFHPRLNFTAYRELRLFRNHPTIRFRNVIHETVQPGIHAVRRETGMAIRDCDIEIEHLGYEGDLTRKHHRNLPMLLEAIEQTPRRSYLWQQLGEIHAALGDDAAARGAFERSIALVRSDADAKQRADATLGAQSYALFLLDRDGDALSVIDEGLAIYAGHRSLLFLRARALLASGDPAPALPILDGLLADGPAFEDSYVAYDRRIFGELAHQLRGVALQRLGRIAEAADAFERAAAAAPGDLGHRARALAVRRLAERKAVSGGARASAMSLP